jgi:hypothetical protein
MEDILALCKRYKVPFGTTAYSTETARRWIGKGAQFFETGSELSLIYNGALHVVEEYKRIKVECLGHESQSTAPRNGS